MLKGKGGLRSGRLLHTRENMKISEVKHVSRCLENMTIFWVLLGKVGNSFEWIEDRYCRAANFTAEMNQIESMWLIRMYTNVVLRISALCIWEWSSSWHIQLCSHLHTHTHTHTCGPIFLIFLPLFLLQWHFGYVNYFGLYLLSPACLLSVVVLPGLHLQHLSLSINIMLFYNSYFTIYLLLKMLQLLNKCCDAFFCLPQFIFTRLQQKWRILI